MQEKSKVNIDPKKFVLSIVVCIASMAVAYAATIAFGGAPRLALVVSMITIASIFCISILYDAKAPKISLEDDARGAFLGAAILVFIVTIFTAPLL